MKKSLLPSIIALSLITPMISLGGVAPLLLVPDAANSSDNSFGGSLEKTLDDPFDYDGNDPSSVLPDQTYNNGSIGYHANLGQDVDAILSYTHTAVSIDADDADLIVDLYGRIDLDCCRDRDDNIDVQIFEGSYDTPIATVSGLMIDNAASGWIRATFDSLPVGTSIDRIRVIGRDSGGGEANNYFTLLEIRSAIVTPNVDLDDDGLPDDWEEANGFSTSDDGSVNPDNGPDGDPDNDLLSNLDEFNNKTDPNDDDSDDDLLKDGEEVAGAGDRPATDPLNGDTDGDNLSDLVETNTGTFVDATDTGSNPTLADSDADGTPDDVEIAGGTDPNDPVSGGNLALGKVGGYFDATGTLTDTWNGLPATNVNDGDLATISHTLAEASTDFYYELDLGAEMSISSVVLTGRGFRDDCCPERLQGQTLVVLTATGTEVFSQAIEGPIVMSETIDLSAAPPFGQLIRIVNTSGAPYGPQLGELAVFGSSTPPAAPVITSLDTDTTTGNVTVTWTSRPGATYSIFGSPNLRDFGEINDSVPSNGTESTFTFNDSEVIGKARYFYYIQQN